MATMKKILSILVLFVSIAATAQQTSKLLIGTYTSGKSEGIYVYDFNKFWHFMVELIQVDKEGDKKLTYPCCLRTEGIAPSQYGTKGLVDSRLAEMEEKYDLQPDALADGFGTEGEEEDEESALGEEERASEEGNDGF